MFIRFFDDPDSSSYGNSSENMSYWKLPRLHGSDLFLPRSPAPFGENKNPGNSSKQNAVSRNTSYMILFILHSS